MVPLSGKVAIVTGRSSGIGRAIAERLGQDGVSVVVNYTCSADKAQEEVVRDIAGGAQAIAIQADISKVKEIFNEIYHTAPDSRRRHHPLCRLSGGRLPE